MLNWVRLYKARGVEGLIPAIHTRKYSPEAKRSAVLDYLNGVGSLDDICTKYDISDRKILRRWIKRYNGHGDFKQPNSGGAIYMTKGGETTLEERIEIVSHCIANNKDYGKTSNGMAYPISKSMDGSGNMRKMEPMGLQTAGASVKMRLL